jgi:cell division septation protein DedD
MADDGFREVQLTGKQLVFLFMAFAVAAVVIFLLGVMVGRGVRGAAGADLAAVQSDAAPVSAESTPGTPPPAATQPTKGDLDYAAMLAGDDTKKIEPPVSPADAPGSAADSATAKGASSKGAAPVKDAAAKDTPVKDAAAKSPDAATPPKPAPPTTAPATSPASATGDWVVQVSALKTRVAAQGVVTSLKAKGYPAFVANTGGATATAFHVQVGPFTDKAEADATRARLQTEGFSPFLVKR